MQCVQSVCSVCSLWNESGLALPPLFTHTARFTHDSTVVPVSQERMALARSWYFTTRHINLSLSLSLSLTLSLSLSL